MTDYHKLTDLLANAAVDRPNRSLGERNLFRLCSPALEWPLPSGLNPEFGRLQLGGSMVQDVTEVLDRHLSKGDYCDVDFGSLRGAMALLARVLDPDRPADYRRLIRKEAIA